MESLANKKHSTALDCRVKLFSLTFSADPGGRVSLSHQHNPMGSEEARRWEKAGAPQQLSRVKTHTHQLGDNFCKHLLLGKHLPVPETHCIIYHSLQPKISFTWQESLQSEMKCVGSDEVIIGLSTPQRRKLFGLSMRLIIQMGSKAPRCKDLCKIIVKIINKSYDEAKVDCAQYEI